MPDQGSHGSSDIESRSQRSAFVARVGTEILAWLKVLGSSAVYATLILTFGFQIARVDGKSMEPTLADQDKLIVNKALYRFFGQPEPGDIVMLYYPDDPDTSFVKRVIAMEGDTVRIVDGLVYVNEVLLEDEFVPPDFRSHENHGPEVVRDAHYFVMGDTGTIALTAGTGVRCQRSTSSGRSNSVGGH